jgi:hypothetical protein
MQQHVRGEDILHGDTLYSIKRKIYKTVCAELHFANVTFNKMARIFYGICNLYFICDAVGLL